MLLAEYVVVALLAVPYLKLVGGVLLIWIGVVVGALVSLQLMLSQIPPGVEQAPK